MSRRPRSPAADGASAPKRRNTGPSSEQDEIARVCTNFIKHLFGCPDLPPDPAPTILPLKQFITYVLRAARLPPSVTFSALFLLERVKTRFPTIDMPSGHRLFITAYIIAAKVLVDPPYRPSWWDVIAYRTFEGEEMHQMEREMLVCLGWDVQVQPDALAEFEEKVRWQFRGLGPYPTPYVLPADVHTPTPFSTPPTAEDGVEEASSAATSHAAPTEPSAEPMDLNPAPIHPIPIPPSEPPVVSPSAPPTPELWSSMSRTPASAEFPATPAGYVEPSGPVVGTGKGATAKVTTTDSQRPTSTSHISGASR
ncbi:hypothetical protein V8D89_003366 [Ganoderma adspersum]